MPREHAPLARVLPYRRAAGELPDRTVGADLVREHGWSVALGERELGDVLLALGLVQALAEATGGGSELRYQGPRPRLMRRCALTMSTSRSDGEHVVGTEHASLTAFHAVPEGPQAWLDVLDNERVEVHAALPMRYYLAAEQSLGVRLPAGRAPLPAFRSNEETRPFHVVFVSATSWPSRKDYGAQGFARIAGVLAERRPAPWTFTLITGADADASRQDDVEIVAGLDAVDCLDVFASAEVVVGNDTGLTHLAAMTERPDGSGPQVIGLYGRHAHTKWITGNARHHAIATPFSQLMSLADRCPVRDRLDDALWSRSADLAGIAAEIVADFATELAGW